MLSASAVIIEKKFCMINNKMKKSILLSLLIGMMGVMALGGCQKRSSCNGYNPGYLHVLNEPYESKIEDGFFKDGVKINAHFYQDGWCCYITGKVPHNVNPNVISHVKLKNYYPKFDRTLYDTKNSDYNKYIYKIICIEGD